MIKNKKIIKKKGERNCKIGETSAVLKPNFINPKTFTDRIGKESSGKYLQQSHRNGHRLEPCKISVQKESEYPETLTSRTCS